MRGNNKDPLRMGGRQRVRFPTGRKVMETSLSDYAVSGY
jgi:hypothetical protein